MNAEQIQRVKAVNQRSKLFVKDLRSRKPANVSRSLRSLKPIKPARLVKNEQEEV